MLSDPVLDVIAKQVQPFIYYDKRNHPMATRYTSNKVPGMAVTIARDGVYIELEGDMIKVSPNIPDDIEKSVLDQFLVIDDSITWHDVESANLHDQYNIK